MRQLLLNVSLRDDARFENFYAGHNQALLNYLKNPAENFIYLYGKPKTGLTHLLQALCHEVDACFYLPLKNHFQFSPDMLENLSHLDLIAIDDIDVIAGQSDWEEKLFHLYNQSKKLVIVSHVLPAQLAIQLPDLKSRLQSMLMAEVKELDDEEKLMAIQLRAKNRGLVLSDEVARFLLNHAPRDMGKLFELLIELDRLSLEEKRRLTIPFVRKIVEDFT